jgi:predicted alpha/beta hydrolase
MVSCFITSLSRLETMHLGQRLAQGAGAVDHDRDEVVVVLDLRPLMEFLDVLHRERVDLEDLAQQDEHLVIGALQVQPEEPVLFHGQLDVGASQLVLQAVREQQMSSHGSHGAKAALGRLSRARH